MLLKEKQLYEKKISELVKTRDVMGLNLLDDVAYGEELKQWAIAIIKGNRSKIREYIKKYIEPGSNPYDDQVIIVGQIIEDFLIDKFELKENDLK